MAKAKSDEEAKSPSGLSTTTVVSLLIAAISLATAIITNAVSLQRITEDLTYIDTSGVAGEWTGVLREYFFATGREEITGQRVDFKVKKGIVNGSISATESQRRDWIVDGHFKTVINQTTNKESRFLYLTYMSTRPNRGESLGSIVLRYDPVQDVYSGYWTGFDIELNQIVTFPYILTRDSDSKAKAKFKEYLEKAPKIAQLPDSPK
jgi:hypothetical protein